MSRIVIAGGTGQVGRELAPALRAAGYDLVVLSRGRGGDAVWDGRTVGDWARALDGAEVVINLAGRSVNCRYNAANRREIMDSRVESTTAIGEAIARADRPPRVWLQASTATIYAHRFDAPNDERSGILGGDEPGVPDTWRFSIDVARAWEAAAQRYEGGATRLVLMRSAMTMGPSRGGILDVLLGLVRRGLGGSVAGGRQYVSWLHHEDFARAVLRLIASDDLHGPINISSPHPLPQAEFMRVLRAASGTRIGLPATRWMAEIGAFAMRTETELVLKSRRVVPGLLLEHGFEFEHPILAGGGGRARGRVAARRLTASVRPPTRGRFAANSGHLGTIRGCCVSEVAGVAVGVLTTRGCRCSDGASVAGGWRGALACFAAVGTAA